MKVHQILENICNEGSTAWQQGETILRDVEARPIDAVKASRDQLLRNSQNYCRYSAVAMASMAFQAKVLSAFLESEECEAKQAGQQRNMPGLG